MKNLTLVFLLVITSSHAFSQKAQMLILDDDIDAKELERTYDVRRASTHRSSLPSREDRELLLAPMKQVKDWDELKRDIFYMELQSKTVEDLQKKYPEFSKKELQALKEKR